MYKGNNGNPVAVWVFTYHDDGKLNVTQSVIDKERFKDTQKGMKSIASWIKSNLKRAKDCPYHPGNPAQMVDDMPGPDSTFGEGGASG